jgi:uncharacterized repeat protein (TIGR03803 family)
LSDFHGTTHPITDATKDNRNELNEVDARSVSVGDNTEERSKSMKRSLLIICITVSLSVMARGAFGLTQQTNFYDLASIALPTSTLAAQAQTLSVLHNFTGQFDGAAPLSGLTMSADGDLYGTTSAGGIHGFGNVYRIAHSGGNWSFSSVYSFQGWTQFSLDGGSPYSRVTIGPDGALYGTTRIGGNGSGCRQLHGCGTIYTLRLTPSGVWTEKMIFQFGFENGENPYYGDVVFDQAGNLYGSTRNGGDNAMGVVYKLAPRQGNWIESVIYSFNGLDGGTPLAGPSIDVSGNMYGTASVGGTYGWGTVYRLSPSNATWSATVLHNFQGGSEGMIPAANVLLDAADNLYGATEAGSDAGGGSAFELARLAEGWNLATLAAFPGSQSGGSFRTLAMDNSGNLYGTTAADGVHQLGSIFKLARTLDGWAYQSLHDFTGGSDGGYPYGTLSFDAAGNIYGTASSGGTYGNGIVFELTP